MTLVDAMLGSISSTKGTRDDSMQKHDACWLQLEEQYVLGVARRE